jgi:hypothetical protein
VTSQFAYGLLGPETGHYLGTSDHVARTIAANGIRLLVAGHEAIRPTRTVARVGDSTDPETRLTLAQRVAGAAAEPVEDNPLILARRRTRGRSILATAALGQAHPLLEAARRTPPPGYDAEAVREAFAAVTGQAAREASAAVGGKAVREAFAAVSGEAVRDATEVLRASTGRVIPSHLSNAAMKAAAETGNGAVRLATAGSLARRLADLGKVGALLAPDDAIPPGLREALVRGIGQQRVSRAPAPSVPGPSPRARRLASGRRPISAPRPTPSVEVMFLERRVLPQLTRSATSVEAMCALLEAMRGLLEEMTHHERASAEAVVRAEARAVEAEEREAAAFKLNRRNLRVTLGAVVLAVVCASPILANWVAFLWRYVS